MSSRNSTIRIPPKAWRALLTTNAGEPLSCDISVRELSGGWTRFQTITNFIAPVPMDNHLAYRLLKPLYNIYVNLGIYQRDLESFDERPILENRRFGGDCLNCHTFLNRRPDTFAINIRSSTNSSHPMLLVMSNEAARVDMTLGYLAWHPSGDSLALGAFQSGAYIAELGQNSARGSREANSPRRHPSGVSRRSGWW